MNKRVTLLALVAFSLIRLSAGERTAPLNILLILADDLGYGDVGCYNDQAMPMNMKPNIRKITEPHRCRT
jgi:hypothetical protein